MSKIIFQFEKICLFPTKDSKYGCTAFVYLIAYVKLIFVLVEILLRLKKFAFLKVSNFKNIFIIINAISQKIISYLLRFSRKILGDYFNLQPRPQQFNPYRTIVINYFRNLNTDADAHVIYTCNVHTSNIIYNIISTNRLCT